ncbi:MAG: DUF3298 and DUF4163 domain-containing protein [Oscillospiraceae bacterium]|jgi:hypothetical protein|nr:DUF3298 and DUF4163 domain-containing protein [Oscillospiraceae bacterium]
MRKFRSLTVFCLLLLLCLSACTRVEDPSPDGPDEPEPPPVTGEEPALPVPSDPPGNTEPPEEYPTPSPPPVYPSVELAADWAENAISVEWTGYQDTIQKGGETALTADGVFPKTGIAAIDSYYQNCRDDFQRLCENRAEEAVETPYSYICDAGFQVEINAGGIFSVSRTVYQFFGGARGGTDVHCETFLVASGKLLTLDDFFTVGRDQYTARLLESVYATIDAEPYAYWPDAKQIVNDLFPYDTFSITRNGISLFFPEYNIAPGVAGIVRIDVPWGAVADIFVLPG